MEQSTEAKQPNRLIRESSPYLLQHAHNPVDWYPWGKEALNRAREEDKPILLSIGYSSCHWCHVMEQESFENEAVAEIMNKRFVNIKVDREERPDLDEIYMNAVQVLTGTGGWPMTVFLTPGLVPFHAGTYFPPEDRGDMPGFKKVLLVISDYYHAHQEEVVKVESQMKDTLRQITALHPSEETLDPGVLAKAFQSLEDQFDPEEGGFGQAPKFPNSMALSFLLRYWKESRNPKALAMAEKTLEKIAQGGIFDPLAGGFHRYAVDKQWRIPHFEKMLYDNALLSRTYFEATQATGKETYRETGVSILNYVLLEMTDPEGGFYSTQDADSEGEEGKYYTWARNEIINLLGQETGTLFCIAYGVNPEGHPEAVKNILHRTVSFDELSQQYKVPLETLKKRIDEGRKTLYAEREKRIKPARDEKILTSWNGLMISGLVDGFKLTGEKRYLTGAVRAARFILRRMIEQGRLMRVYFKGTCRVEGFSEDYAFFIQALIDLYEADFDLAWLKEAAQLNLSMMKRFWDPQDGGLFFTEEKSGDLLIRSKNPYDNAIPSANAIAVANCIRLGFLTGDDSLKNKGGQILRLFYPLIDHHPSGFLQMLSALSFYLNPEEIAVFGSMKDHKVQAMLKTLYRSFLPHKILSFRDPGDTIDKDWFPSLQGKETTQAPAAFICRGSTCLSPVSDEKELKKILE